MEVHIPEILKDGDWDTQIKVPNQPGWIRIKRYSNGQICKPLIRCNCGKITGIGLHHVYVDGRVTASFYDKFNNPYNPDGCGWHVFLVLDGWDGGEFPPGTGEL